MTTREERGFLERSERRSEAKNREAQFERENYGQKDGGRPNSHKEEEVEGGRGAGRRRRQQQQQSRNGCENWPETYSKQFGRDLVRTEMPEGRGRSARPSGGAATDRRKSSSSINGGSGDDDRNSRDERMQVKGRDREEAVRLQREERLSRKKKL